jgi:CO dehydrogenase maturation factor
MRIATIGKGGSGKSTIASGLVKFFSGRSDYVLAVDADINRHLSLILGIPRSSHDIGGLYKEIFTYLEGERVDVSAFDRIPEIGSIPPADKSKSVLISPSDVFLTDFASFRDNIFLLTAGTYEEEDIGTTCIHVKLKALELLMHRVKDRIDQAVIVDVTAGTDPLSTTLVFAYDLNLIVVEPTAKSVKVFEDYLMAADQLDKQIFAIGNKVESLEDEKFLESRIPAQKLLGTVKYSKSLALFNQGNLPAFDNFVAENEEIWGLIVQKAKECSVNRSERLAMVNKTFLNSCKNWFNDYYKLPLDQIFLKNV